MYHPQATLQNHIHFSQQEVHYLLTSGIFVNERTCFSLLITSYHELFISPLGGTWIASMRIDRIEEANINTTTSRRLLFHFTLLVQEKKRRPKENSSLMHLRGPSMPWLRLQTCYEYNILKRKFGYICIVLGNLKTFFRPSRSRSISIL